MKQHFIAAMCCSRPTTLSVDIHHNETLRTLSGTSQVDKIDLPEVRSL